MNILDKFAARLNSFKIGYRDYWPGKNDINTFDLLTRASKAGINAADLNFPDHFENIKLQELNETLKQLNIHLLHQLKYLQVKLKLLIPKRTLLQNMKLWNTIQVKIEHPKINHI